MKNKMKKVKKLFKYIIVILVALSLGFIYLNMKYPIGYNSTIQKYSKEYNLDPYLIASIINVESSYDKEAISPKSAKGLMQISPQTGQWASEELNIEDYSEDKLFQPEINIRIGSWYLDRLKTEFNDDLDLILIAYNAGSGNLSKWLDNEEYSENGRNITHIPFKETEDYLVRVKKNHKIYSTFYKDYFKNTEEDPLYISVVNNIRNLIKKLIKY